MSERVDVVVLGASLGGLLCAEELARGGARVVVVESRHGGQAGSTARGPGVAQLGGDEPLWRLLEGLGDARTRELLQFSAASLRRLTGRPGVLRSGGLRVAMGDREAGELDRVQESFETLGVPVARLSAEEVGSRLGSLGFGPAILVSEDLQVHTAELMSSLEARALEASVELRSGCAVQAVQADDQGLQLRCPGPPLHCELLVYASGPELASLDPWLSACLHPARGLTLRTTPLAEPPSIGGSAQLGYLCWNPLPDRSLLVSGARWATPHLELGETDDELVQPQVLDKLEAFLHRSFPATREQELTSRVSRIFELSCDGLPLVGALPGRGRELVCAGFGGQDLAFAPEAATRLARAILGEDVEPLPVQLRPDRML